MMLVFRDAIDEGVPNPRGQSLANLSIAFACVSFAFVAIRIWTRVFVHRISGPDDYLIVIAQALAITMAVSYNEEVRNGFGLHTKQVDPHHKITALKWFFLAQLLYKVAICLVKLSILLLYLRIFPSPRFRIASYAVIGVTVAYTIGSLCATIWQCNPIGKAWNRALHGSCINIGGVWYGTSVMAIITDVFIIVLPIQQIRRLQLPLSQKIGLSILFSLGFFVIGCTIVRMAIVGPAVTQKDTMYYQATSNSWTFLEVNVGIICACLPVLKTPVSLVFNFVTGKKSTTKGVSAELPYIHPSNVTPRNRILSPNNRTAASDEYFILEDTKSIKVSEAGDVGASQERMPPRRNDR